MGIFCKRNKAAAMPPTSSHAQREWQPLPGLPGRRYYFYESNQRGTLGMPLFSGKPGKSAFRETKSIKENVFYVLFASAKRTKKQPGLRPATSVQSATQACFL